MATVETDRTEVRAQAKWVRVSARKARLVTEHLRGRTVPEARAVLAFTSRAAARQVELVLRSAVANAEANHGLAGDDLVVVAAYVDEGPTIKRFRPRARGRVGRIAKRTCHITLKLAPADEAAGRPKRRPAAVPAKAAVPVEEPQELVEAPAASPEAAVTPEPETVEPEAAEAPAPGAGEDAEPEAAEAPEPEPEPEPIEPPAAERPPRRRRTKADDETSEEEQD
jgi:large subunit ribosomal protein L22